MTLINYCSPLILVFFFFSFLCVHSGGDELTLNLLKQDQVRIYRCFQAGEGREGRWDLMSKVYSRKAIWAGGGGHQEEAQQLLGKWAYSTTLAQNPLQLV